MIGQTYPFDFLAGGRIDGYYKGRVTMESAALDRNVSPEQLVLADKLKEAGILVTKFNWSFFTAPDASDTRPEAAGLGIAVIGSAYMMLIVLVLSLPLGVALRSISRNSPRRTGSPTSSRSTSPISRPCPRSSSVSSALRC